MIRDLKRAELFSKAVHCRWATWAVVVCELGLLIEKFGREMMIWVRIPLLLQELGFLDGKCEQEMAARPMVAYVLVAGVAYSWALAFWWWAVGVLPAVSLPPSFALEIS